LRTRSWPDVGSYCHAKNAIGWTGPSLLSKPPDFRKLLRKGRCGRTLPGSNLLFDGALAWLAMLDINVPRPGHVVDDSSMRSATSNISLCRQDRGRVGAISAVDSHQFEPSRTPSALVLFDSALICLISHVTPVPSVEVNSVVVASCYLRRIEGIATTLCGHVLSHVTAGKAIPTPSRNKNSLRCTGGEQILTCVSLSNFI
jgi:hypothetical protein